MLFIDLYYVYIIYSFCNIDVLFIIYSNRVTELVIMKHNENIMKHTVLVWIMCLQILLWCHSFLNVKHQSIAEVIQFYLIKLIPFHF